METPTRTKRILMLGWEYPPMVNGGLGVACRGLARALSSGDSPVTVDMLVPYAVQESKNLEHLKVRGLNQLEKEDFSDRYPAPLQKWPVTLDPYADAKKENSPPRSDSFQENKAEQLYSGDLGRKVQDYTTIVSQLNTGKFEVIHAHDWMTFPAALELKKRTGLPVVAHIHSTQYDRSGPSDRGWIFQVEQKALELADVVVAVSHYTKTILERYYQISPSKIAVVHNGIEPAAAKAQNDLTEKKAPTVLFLGRLTAQKGPEFFLEVARRVIEKLPSTRFLLAGEGDKRRDLEVAISYWGLSENVQLLGFLDEEKKEQIFQQTTLLLMPSVSEPFGLAALEAASQGVPAILTKEAGVGEVLQSAPRAHYYETQAIAQHVIEHLSKASLLNQQAMEQKAHAQQATWEKAAQKIRQLYSQFL